MTSTDSLNPSGEGSPSPEQRWIRVGSSTAVDTDQAVAEVLRVLEDGAQPELVLLFSSMAHDLARAADRIASVVGEDRLIGCTTAGELASGTATRGGMTLWALGGEGVSVAVNMGQGSPAGLRDAARQAATCLERLQSRAHTVLLLLADGLCGDQVEVVRGAYEVAGVDVPLVGGCAGDDMAMQRTRQIFGKRVLERAVVAAAISSDAPLGIGVSHCWEPIGEPMLVTGSTGTAVMTLEDRPALDVYFEAFDAPEEVRRNLEAFSIWATTRPLGIRRRDRIEIRYVSGADFQQRSLLTIAEVPQGGVAHLMRGDAVSVLEATQKACAMAADGLGGAAMRGMLLFDCVARRSVLQEEWLHGEIARIDAVRGDVPVGGFYTYGEIARIRGAGGFHNQTLVALAVA
ncbi:MAG: FIST N-terminal domain-containing protein [Synechococcus sp. ELA057]